MWREGACRGWGEKPHKKYVDPEEGWLSEEIERRREAVKETVESILALCPAYNKLALSLMAIEGVGTLDAARLYPDLFHLDGVKIFSELLGVGLGEEVKLTYEGLAEKLVDSAKPVEDYKPPANVLKRILEAERRSEDIP